MIEWGPHIETLKEYQGAGQSVRVLDERPGLLPGLVRCWDSFWEMQRDRPFSVGGPLPIPSRVINRRVAEMGLKPAASRRYRELWKTMDDRYLKRAAEKAEKERNSRD